MNHKEIHSDFKEYEEVTNRLLNLYLETSDDHEPDFEDEEVDTNPLLSKLSNSDTDSLGENAYYSLISGVHKIRPKY